MFSLPTLRRAAAGTGSVFLALAAAAGAHAADTPVGATTVGGKLFLDVSHLNQYRNGQRTATSRDGADLKRFYIDVDHRFSQVWSAHLTTDINWMRNNSPTDLWVKHAYLQGAFSKALVLRFGVVGDKISEIDIDADPQRLRRFSLAVLD